MNRSTLLTILQQGEYFLPQFQAWAKAHAHDAMELKPEQWTPKLKLIRALSLGLFFLPPVTAISLATQAVTPFERLMREVIYWQAGSKLWWYKMRGLKVIAIAGSYGKTSTKNILSHVLSGSLPTLITPQSYNTLLGIARVIRRDLKPEHKVFVVEFGEYHPEDIPALTQFVKPHFGILTPLGRQHLDIIGGFENVVKTFEHFVQYFVKNKRPLLAHEHNQAHYPSFGLTTYGSSPQAALRVFNCVVSRAGTEFEILDQRSKTTMQLFSPLFGEHQAVNSVSALWAAQHLKLDITSVLKRFRTLPYIERRHQPTFGEQNVLILDNSYNTNADSVSESLKLINQLQPTNRVIITLGFTELGAESQQIHYQFGRQLAGSVDYVGLIKAPWSNAIVEGFTAAGGHLDHIIVAESQQAAFDQLKPSVIPGSVVLFEGGYREVYI